ncbi:perlucin-like [Crassostrea virginica]|uniref:Hepatic lectin-like n=1 Tax=Crassostrea virginica TaxID=6565 RepID=A0A8B8AE98_CRAVI|nr:hepatic lectin-like [Crassostrea virginica]
MSLLPLLTLLSVLSVCLCDCGVGWAEFNGECIYFSHDKHTFADAAARCHNMMRSYLVTVDNKPKADFINRFLSALHHFHQTGYWLGGNDYIKEGEWRWSETGSPIGDFNQWGPGYPDGNRTHDCMLQVYNGDSSMWIDSNCNHGHYYICEHPAPTTSTVIG